MKKKLSLLFLALVATIGAWADVLTLTPSNGTYPSSSGNYVNSITFSTEPVITIAVNGGANNMDKRQTDSYLLWHSGTAGSSTYTITVTGDYVITAYSVTGEANTSAQTLTAGSVSHEFAVGTSSSFDVTSLNSSSVSFVQTGANASGLKITSISVTVEEISWTPSVEDAYLTIGGKATSISPVIETSDNSKWYILTQVRGGETPMYDAGTGNTLRRAATSITTTTLNGTSVSESAIYLIRFVNVGEGLYNVQFADGNWITSSLATTSSKASAGTYAFYFTNDAGALAWNLDSKSGQRVDNNGAGQTVAFWGSGENTATSGNNIWTLYETTVEVPTSTVTYIVKDGSDNVLFTSEPVATTNGANITTLPAEYQLTNFYTYNTVNVTISASGNTNVEFTATPKENPLVRYTADTSNPYYYNLNIRSQYLVYNSEATGQVTLQSTSEPFNANASWAFIGEPYAGFKVINKTKGTDYFLTYTSVVTGGNGGNNNIQFVAAADFNNRYWIIDNNTNGFVLRMKENTNIYFHHDNTHKLLRTCSTTEWSAVHNDAGSTLVASTDEDVLIALYDSMKDYTYSDAIGQYSAEGITAAEANATISSVGTAITNNMTSAYADAYAALNALQAKTSLNSPAAGFYRVKNVATNGYLYATAASGYTSTDRHVYANGNNSGAETIIQLAEHNGHLYMLTQGHEFGWIAQPSTGSGQVGYVRANGFDKYVNWLPGSAAGQIAFAICYGNGTGGYASYLTQGIYAVDTQDNAVIRGSDYTEDAAQWIFEPVETLTVPLNDGGDGIYYATFCVPFDVNFGTSAAAFTLSKDGTTLETTEVPDNTVPAGTPVLLVGEGNSATATIGSNYSNAPVSGTALTGNYFAIPFDGATNYVLGTDGTKVGFFHWNGDVLKANRAYIAGEAAGGAKGFYLDDSFATAIQKLTDAADGNAIYYDLSGRRVAEPKQGLYIVNGKKVVVK